MRLRPLLTATAILFVVSLLAAWPVSAQPGAAIDRGYITPNAVLAAMAHPHRVLTAARNWNCCRWRSSRRPD